MSKAISKGVYAAFKFRTLTTPTAQRGYTDLFAEYTLEWKEIYNLPFMIVLGGIRSQENYNLKYYIDISQQTPYQRKW